MAVQKMLSLITLEEIELMDNTINVMTYQATHVRFKEHNDMSTQEMKKKYL